MTILEIEQVLDIDLDEDIKCQSKVWGDCDRPVGWKMYHTCCGWYILICDHHKQKNELHLSLMQVMDIEKKCINCWHDGDHTEFRRV